jgi:hypothetical protein
MDIGMFIKKCFEIGISLLNKEKLTEEEKELLNALDSLEKWIQDRILFEKKVCYTLIECDIIIV